MPTILITNDDGITSPGIIALEKAMQKLGNTIVVAPDNDNSAVSNSVTITRPLRLTEHQPNRFSLSGTPTDCVILGLNTILSSPPSLVVSGINLGPNLGDDLHYSGTVGAAKEAVMNGIPAIAFSSGDREGIDFDTIINNVYHIASRALAHPLPPQSLLNVNFPSGNQNKGIRLTFQGRRRWLDAILETKEPCKTPYYRIGGGTPREDESKGSDVQAYNSGYISVTPIQLDLTDHQLLKDWKNKEVRFI